MKIDRLFLERDCPHCGAIKAALDINAVSDDDFRGKDGQELYVFASQSNRASIEMLSKFGLAGRPIPLLLTHEEVVITDEQEIVTHLSNQGMTV